jgi:hypothetical protein
MELRNRLLNAAAGIEFRPASEARLGYPHHDKLLEYYVRGIGEWYLWWGNDAVGAERRGIAPLLTAVSGRLTHRLLSGLSRVPPLVAVVSEHNEAALAKAEALRHKVERAGGLVIASAVAFALVLFVWSLHKPVGSVVDPKPDAYSGANR